jgi:nicotinic acid phosphoribosyltransferase
VIQGDGINYRTVETILARTTAAGFSAQNVAFGMGGGLLQVPYIKNSKLITVQKVNRDTMSFATKLCHIYYADGVARYIRVLRNQLTYAAT